MSSLIDNRFGTIEDRVRDQVNCQNRMGTVLNWFQMGYIDHRTMSDIIRENNNLFQTEYQNEPYMADGERSISENVRTVQEECPEEIVVPNLEMASADMWEMHGIDISREIKAFRDLAHFNSMAASFVIQYPSDISKRCRFEYNFPGGRLQYYKSICRERLKQIEEKLPKTSIGWLEL